VFVFPSSVETFGNPLVEAMACGAAIACSNTAAMPEVLGDAGQYFDPYDSGQIAASILQLMTDDTLRQEMRQRARKRSAHYSWKLTEQKTVSVLMRR
jgi:glycosyltransferase involved in cell wall biosynthesis